MSDYKRVDWTKIHLICDGRCIEDCVSSCTPDISSDYLCKINVERARFNVDLALQRGEIDKYRYYLNRLKKYSFR